MIVDEATLRANRDMVKAFVDRLQFGAIGVNNGGMYNVFLAQLAWVRDSILPGSAESWIAVSMSKLTRFIEVIVDIVAVGLWTERQALFASSPTSFRVGCLSPSHSARHPIGDG